MRWSTVASENLTTSETTWKRCKIGCKLILITNRKSHMSSWLLIATKIGSVYSWHLQGWSVYHCSALSALYPIRLLSCILSQLNILCTSLVKPCYSKNDHSCTVIHRTHVTDILRVLRRTGFHRSRVFHISKRSVLYQSQNCVLNFTAFRYSLHKCHETILW